MAGDTIKEFLVALGFDVDDTSFGKFISATKKAGLPVVKLGAAAIATATAVEVMVETVARQMQDLYYASQRTGVAAKSIQAVGYAAKQLGMDASSGRALIEAFSRSMRINPGIQGLLANLGGEFQNINGQVGLTDKGLFNVLERLKAMPRYQALLFGNIFGLDPEALNTVLNNLDTFEDRTKRAEDMAKSFGLNLDDAGKKGNQFSQDVDTMAQAFEDLSIKAGVDWMPIADKVIKGITDGTVAFGEWVAKGHELVLMFGSLAAAVGGVSAALKIMSAIPTLGWLSGLAGILTRLAGILTRASLLLGSLWLLYESIKPTATNAGEQAHIAEHPELYPPNRTKTFAVGPEVAPGVNAGNPAAIVDYFEKAGWSHEQALGILANLQAESSLNPAAVGDHGEAFGIAQWHGDRRAAFRNWKGYNMGADLGDQLAFINHELNTDPSAGGDKLRAATNARDAAAAFSQYYERPKGGVAEAARRGEMAANISLTNNNTFNITGKDSDQIGQSVEDRLKKVNDALVRNLGGGQTTVQ